MTRKTAFLLTVIFLFTAQACTIQGLPYPTDTPDPNLITPDLEATREMAEAGMFPSSTPDPQSSRTAESLPTATPLDDSSLSHMPSLKVAYIVDGDVWYWELGQPPLQLTTSGDAVDVILSDDWSQAAFMRQIDQFHQALWVVNTDGSWLHGLFAETDFDRLTSEGSHATVPFQLDWVPGKNMVALVTIEIRERPGQLINYELINIDTGEPPVVISRLGPGEGGQFTYSQDGSKIAFVTPEHVFVTDANGGNRSDLFTYKPVDTGSEYSYFPPLVWTPDGNAVRVIIPPQYPRGVYAGLTKLYHSSLSSSSYISAGFSTVSVFQSEPVLSPDTTKLAYIAPPVSQYGESLRIWETGGDEFIYDVGELDFLAWSMDNINFLYTKEGVLFLGQYGNEPVPFDGISNLVNVQFVDTARYLYVQLNEGNQQLWLGDIEGSRILLAESSSMIEYDFVR